MYAFLESLSTAFMYVRPKFSTANFSIFNAIYKIPKLHIPSALLINFQPFQLSSSGTNSKLLGKPKFVPLADELYSQSL